MKPSLTEGKFLLYIVFSVLILVSIYVFRPQISSIYDPANFLSFHMILEFFAISISFSIFLYGWKKHKQTKSGKLLLISLVFFTIGMIDLVHTLTFKGMPVFINESSVAKATWFWVIARTIEAASMLLLLLLPERVLNRDPRNLLLTLSIAVITFIIFIVFRYETSLPILVVEGEGTTFIKNLMEYIVCFLRIVSIIVALLFYNERKQQEFLYFALAFTILFLSELIFTIYQSVYDIDNFSGHLFKVVGYFFILKGFYFSIEKATLSGNLYQKDSIDVAKLVHEYQGIFFTFTKKDDRFVHTTCDGELLDELGFTPDKVIGYTMDEIFPAKAEKINTYYQHCWEKETPVSFRLSVRNKWVIFKLKPIFLDNEIVQVLGTAIDVTNVDECDKKITQYNSLHM
ncbi:MASE3 domain-containing protein [Bacillus marasmi]|uniref:MASE3 domain-containing protein n=1 Tax=Bacillus marasmi TaxID=1926279 RepID=UPI0011C74D4E|nr:MASE3 domain-containing protein [Bacillus marasmi]